MKAEFHLVWIVATSVPGQHVHIFNSLLSKTAFRCWWNIHHRFGRFRFYTPASQQEDPSLILGSSCAEFARLCGFSVVSSHIQVVQVRQSGDSKLPVGMSVSVSGCLPICVQPAVDWRPAICPAIRPVHVGIGCSSRCARKGLGRQGN